MSDKQQIDLAAIRMRDELAHYADVCIADQHRWNAVRADRRALLKYVDALTAANAALTEANGRWAVECADLRIRLAEAERKWADAESDKLKADADLAVLQARPALREVAEAGELQTALEENERLRSRLAEADALLREAQTYGIPAELYLRIDAHLSRKGESHE